MFFLLTFCGNELFPVRSFDNKRLRIIVLGCLVDFSIFGSFCPNDLIFAGYTAKIVKTTCAKFRYNPAIIFKVMMI